MTSERTISPTLTDVVFSVKAFAAAMLALFVALCFDLQNPYWAVGTVYIVAHPLSGASTSKALYRLLGTAMGGAMTTILVPNLVNSPEILTLAISLWIGLCLVISLLDRTPRSYVFLLGGYTTALTGFPLVSAPETAFTYTTGRVTEIAVGIICTAVVSRVIFPVNAGPVLTKRIEAWLNDGKVLAISILEGRHDDKVLARTSQRLASDAVDLRGFTTHVSYDASDLREKVALARQLQRRMVAMLPMTSGLADALGALSRETDGSYTPAIRKLLADTAAWVNSEQSLGEDQRQSFLDTIATAVVEAGALPEWQRLLVHNVIARLRDLIQIWSDCFDLKQDIVAGSHHKLRWHGFGALLDTQPIHKDYGMALYSGLSMMLATFIVVAFWIFSGWSQGGTAAMMTAVVCCLFSSMDDPVPGIRSFLYASIVAVIGAFVMEFGVFPLLHGYVPLVAALGLVLVPVGLLMARPATMLMGMGIGVNFSNMVSLQDRLSLDLETFVNGNLALLLGLAAACGVTALIRSFGAEWGARRLLHAGWRDIVAAARKRRGVDVGSLLDVMLDRFGLLAPRLAKIEADSPISETDPLRDLRNGLNTIELQRHKQSIDGDARAAIDAVLVAIASHYEAKRRNVANDPAGNILAYLDRAITSLNRAKPSPAIDACLRALAGLRYNIFPDVQAFEAGTTDTQPKENQEEKAA